MRGRANDLFYLIPPAGTPIKLADISRIVKMRFFSGPFVERFDGILKRYFNVRYCLLFNSGRAALTFLLNTLQKLADYKKDEVVIPAYTCFSVAAAIARSGLKIRTVDIDPHTMDYNYDKLKGQNFGNVLAIVGCNLFGILSDWNWLLPFSREKNVYLIDDAAQSMGSTFQNRVSGSLGDAGFFSLGRGKNLSTISGGILITENEHIASNIDRNMRDLKKGGSISEMKILLEIMFYALLLNPRLYWMRISR
jgi:perosamine synthetase